jgi:hypothetical protein
MFPERHVRPAIRTGALVEIDHHVAGGEIHPGDLRGLGPTAQVVRIVEEDRLLGVEGEGLEGVGRRIAARVSVGVGRPDANVIGIPAAEVSLPVPGRLPGLLHREPALDLVGERGIPGNLVVVADLPNRVGGHRVGDHEMRGAPGRLVVGRRHDHRRGDGDRRLDAEAQGRPVGTRRVRIERLGAPVVGLRAVERLVQRHAGLAIRSLRDLRTRVDLGGKRRVRRDLEDIGHRAAARRHAVGDRQRDRLVLVLERGGIRGCHQVPTGHRHGRAGGRGAAARCDSERQNQADWI